MSHQLTASPRPGNHRHKQKQVDLSIPFRVSGLVSGAKLELVQKSKTACVVSVALQLPHPDAKEIPGGRLIRKFPSDLTLWQILRQFESGDASAGRNINITARGVAVLSGTRNGGGHLYYEKPVLNIMGRDMASFADFQKTLSQLGCNSGSVLIRLSYQKTDQTLHEAMEQIGQFFKDADGEGKQTVEHAAADPAPAETEDVDTQRIPPDLTAETTKQDQPGQEEASASPSSSSSLAAETSTQSNQPSPSRDCLQPVNVFLAPSGPTPAAASAPVNETDFTPTVAHAQLHQRRLQENSRNKRLLSDREIEEKEVAERARLEAVKSLLVKVRFPDNTSSDWELGPAVTGAFLYKAVRHVMASAEQPFRLVLPGGKPVIKDEDSPGHSLVKGYKLSGRVLVNLIWEDGVPREVRSRPFLKAAVARQGQAVKVPDVPQSVDDWHSAMADAAPETPDKPNKQGAGHGGGKKMPKWFKMGKK